MKNLKILTLITIFAFSLSLNSNAQKRKKRGSDNDWKRKGDKNFEWRRGGDDGSTKGAVGAPLDGGLLAILGAAGVTYYVSRKKKRNGETE